MGDNLKRLWDYLDTAKVRVFFVVPFGLLPIPYRIEMNWACKVGVLICMAALCVIGFSAILLEASHG